MFTRGSFAPTYSGPMLASGETLRRAVSDAGANQSFVGNQRGYQPRNKGVSAGSKAMQYRANMMADTQAASQGGFQSAYLQHLTDNAQARSAFDRNASQERDSLRRLLLDTESVDRTSDLAQRQDQYFSELKRRERAAERRIGDYNRQGGIMGFLGSLF
jgi:hypothetical protein